MNDKIGKAAGFMIGYFLIGGMMLMFFSLSKHGWLFWAVIGFVATTTITCLPNSKKDKKNE